MIKENMRIKENITLLDKIDAVESIVSSYFTDDDYTPYYVEMAEVIAVVTYFIEGITFEDNDSIYDLYNEDKELRDLVEQFIIDDISMMESTSELEIMRWVRNQVFDKVDFTKENIIHSNPDLDTIVEAANVIIESLGNFSKLNFEYMTPENMDMIQNVLRKLNDSDLTIDSISKILKDAVGFDMDKAAAEIIDAKNKKITDLQKYKALDDAKNVLADK